MPLRDDIDATIERLISAAPELPAEAPRPRRRLKVVRIWQEGPRYVGVQLDVEGAFDDLEARPGQYVTLAVEGLEPCFFAIANAPSRWSRQGWEFLIDRAGEAGPIFEALRPGDAVLASPPEGSGYPVAEVVGRGALLFTTGSGIASLRPVLQHWSDHPDQAPCDVALYYGEGTRGDFAYTDELADWRARGVQVYQAIGDLPGRGGGYRYVQHAFEADAPDLTDAVVFLSGAPIMLQAVTALLLERHIPANHIFTNI